MTMIQTDRRKILAGAGVAFGALVASGCSTRGAMPQVGSASLPAYGPLVKDPAGMLDLPQGFSYRLLSSLGNAMSDGGTVPDKADGMGCFDLGLSLIHISSPRDRTRSRMPSSA